MFVDATCSRALPAALALVLAACGGPRVVPSRPASDADVRAVLVAEARVAEGRALALGPAHDCETRLAGSRTARLGARSACDVARGTDDRDLVARCVAAERGAREADRVATVACAPSSRGGRP